MYQVVKDFFLRAANLEELFWKRTPTSALEVMLMLASLHLFIKQEARQAANRLLRHGCSYVPNFGHSEVLIKMTDEMPLYIVGSKGQICDP
jgi:hypothetical protein